MAKPMVALRKLVCKIFGHRAGDGTRQYDLRDGTSRWRCPRCREIVTELWGTGLGGPAPNHSSNASDSVPMRYTPPSLPLESRNYILQPPILLLDAIQDRPVTAGKAIAEKSVRLMTRAPTNAAGYTGHPGHLVDSDQAMPHEPSEPPTRECSRD